MSNDTYPERSYHTSGVLLGRHTLQERDAYIAQRVCDYDWAHPNNTLTRRQKRKYARYRWQRKIRKEIEFERMTLEKLNRKEEMEHMDEPEEYFTIDGLKYLVTDELRQAMKAVMETKL